MSGNSENVREIIESHHCFCEVSMYYIVSEDRTVGRPVSVRRIQAGFEVDIYGVKRVANRTPRRNIGSSIPNSKKLSTWCGTRTTMPVPLR